MNVWIVQLGYDYEGERIEEVFSSKKKAMNYIEKTYPERNADFPLSSTSDYWELPHSKYLILDFYKVN